MVHSKTDTDIDSNDTQLLKKHERRIVSWSKEEDDILRDQIQRHGTPNWAIIASKFMDKTTRQCRRRWFTYLNSDCKKGGWSPEEDMLLCKAQKKYGNRWTEIAKVVSGRTDNAVKNRFTTLCRKRAKSEALSNEYGLSSDESSKSGDFVKRIRTCISNTVETCEQVKEFIVANQSIIVVEDNLKQNQESDLYTVSNSDTEFHLIELAEGQARRDPTVQNTPSSTSSEYSTGSTILSNTHSEKTEELEAGISLSLQFYDTSVNGAKNNVPEFSSPLRVTPMFQTLAAAIPSPQFSESEKHFLMKTLGIESPNSAMPITDISQPPPCKRLQPS